LACKLQDSEERVYIALNLTLFGEKCNFNLKFYKLNPDFGLRSWDQTPKYAVAVKFRGVEPVTDEAFQNAKMGNLWMSYRSTNTTFEEVLL
jgi:hypothetical protein